MLARRKEATYDRYKPDQWLELKMKRLPTLLYQLLTIMHENGRSCDMLSVTMIRSGTPNISTSMPQLNVIVRPSSTLIDKLWKM